MDLLLFFISDFFAIYGIVLFLTYLFVCMLILS